MQFDTPINAEWLNQAGTGWRSLVDVLVTWPSADLSMARLPQLRDDRTHRDRKRKGYAGTGFLWGEVGVARTKITIRRITWMMIRIVMAMIFNLFFFVSMRMRGPHQRNAGNRHEDGHRDDTHQYSR